MMLTNDQKHFVADTYACTLLSSRLAKWIMIVAFVLATSTHPFVLLFDTVDRVCQYTVIIVLLLSSFTL